MKCQNCRKGVSYGNLVSHAKNRTKRLFKPNLQKIKVLKNGISTKVKLCTKCIKRLKKDGRIGSYFFLKTQKKVQKVESAKLPVVSIKKEKEKKEKARETIKIEEILGKKS